jgi:hypothetical protein
MKAYTLHSRRNAGSPPQLLLEPVAIRIVTNNVLAAVAAGHHMVDRARVLDSQSSWHALD